MAELSKREEGRKGKEAGEGKIRALANSVVNQNGGKGRRGQINIMWSPRLRQNILYPAETHYYTYVIHRRTQIKN